MGHPHFLTKGVVHQKHLQEVTPLLYLHRGLHQEARLPLKCQMVVLPHQVHSQNNHLEVRLQCCVKVLSYFVRLLPHHPLDVVQNFPLLLDLQRKSQAIKGRGGQLHLLINIQNKEVTCLALDGPVTNYLYLHLHSWTRVLMRTEKN